MYSGGHILTTTALSMAVSKKLDLDFVKLTPLLLAANLVDYDHLMFYYLDDGTANSLVLHPLHIYSGILFFLLFLGGVIFRKHLKWVFAFSGSLALHYTMDALAYFANYSILFLGVADVVMLLAIIAVYPGLKLKVPSRPMILFLILSVGISNGVLAYLGLVLKLVPQESIIYYILNPSLIALAAWLFWVLFKKYCHGRVSAQRVA